MAASEVQMSDLNQTFQTLKSSSMTFSENGLAQMAITKKYNVSHQEEEILRLLYSVSTGPEVIKIILNSADNFTIFEQEK